VFNGQTLRKVNLDANIDVHSDSEESMRGSWDARVLAGKWNHRDAALTPGERQSDTRMMGC
jgi:hypothetical protein